jgi:hypothetical protein
MIVKVCFGNNGHTRVIECSDIHLEKEKGYTELICHGDYEFPKEVHLGKRTEDHLYLMDKGQTIDHMIFSPEVEPPKEVREG